jgi:hypothetical protein
MSRIIKSNPDYTKLAYLRAIRQEVVNYLSTNFTAAYGDAPKKIHCEEVFQDESIVPETIIAEFINGENKTINRLEDDIAQYALEKRKHVEEQPEASDEARHQGKADAGKHGHHRQGGARKRAAPAEQ